MSHGRSPRVLYVEDDECLHEIVAAVLAADGFEVTSVSLASAALAALEQQTFDLVIADYHLPDGNGAGLLRQAHRQNLLEGVGVLMLTSELRPIGIRGVPVLRKPVDCDALLIAARRVTAVRVRDSGVRLRRGSSQRLVRVR